MEGSNVQSCSSELGVGDTKQIWVPLCKQVHHLNVVVQHCKMQWRLEYFDAIVWDLPWDFVEVLVLLFPLIGKNDWFSGQGNCDGPRLQVTPMKKLPGIFRCHLLPVLEKHAQQFGLASEHATSICWQNQICFAMASLPFVHSFENPLSHATWRIQQRPIQKRDFVNAV